MATNPYNNIVKLSDGTTIMDITDTTATASDVAQGKYFYAANGEKTLGTASGGGGADMPTFTIVWDDNYESVVSATCDWTFAECDDYSGGVALVNDNTQSGTNEEIGSATIIGGDGSYIDYTVYMSGVYPAYDIRYNSNGTISVTFPTQTYETLNVTANGTYYPQGGIITEVNVNVSGGGGASNVVTGTFTGTTTGVAMDVALNYTGTGYPIAVVIFPIEGSYNNSSSFYSLLQRYVISQYVMTKINNTAPTYSTSGSNNGGTVQLYYKNSASDVTAYGRSGSTNQNIYSGSNSSSTNYFTVRFKSATTMSVFIASTSYGFAANYEYKYCVMYSS